MYQPARFVTDENSSPSSLPRMCCAANDSGNHVDNYPQHPVLPPPQQPTVYSHPEASGPESLVTNSPIFPSSVLVSLFNNFFFKFIISFLITYYFFFLTVEFSS